MRGLETESRCQAWMEGRSLSFGLEIVFKDLGGETGLAGISNTQYAKFRIPMSILNILVGFSAFSEVSCDWISSSSRPERVGFVPEVEIPHLKASCFNCTSFKVLGSRRDIYGLSF